MALQVILKNSSVSGKEPTVGQLANGEISLNYHSSNPFICCKDTSGAIRRIAGVWIKDTPPESPTPGEFWLDKSLTPALLKVYQDNTATWVAVAKVEAASESVAGVVELASDQETQEGLDALRAVTPASLQSKVSDSTSTTSSTTLASSTAVKSAKDVADAALPRAGGTMTGPLEIGSAGSLVFEGSTANDFETTLAVTDPTADRTITLPDQSGNVLVSGNASIVNADISASAEIAVSKLADGAARQVLQTAANGTDVEWTDNLDLPGTLDVTGAAVFDNNVTVQGDLTVQGTTTTINTENLVVEDKNIQIGTVSTPSDVTADGGGITLKGTTDKTLNWVDATDSWTSSENVNLASGKTFKINGTDVLSATALGSAVQISSDNIPAGTITNDDLAGSIADTKLATISTADKVSLSALNIDGGTDIGGALADADLFIVDDGGAGTNRKAAATRITDYAFGKVSGDVIIASNGTAAIGSGVIVNADVNASAAIAGTKVSPDFGAQNVTTTGTSTAASFIPTSSTVPTNGVYLPAANTVGLATNGAGRLFVNSAGIVRVGSGTDGLYISPNTSGSAYLTTDIGLTATSLVIGTSSDVPIRFVANNQERLRITSAGLVGIGTTSPNAQLHVVTSGAGGIRFADGTRAAELGSTGTVCYAGSVTLGQDFALYSANAERARIDSSGRLLVGTSTSAGAGAIFQIRSDSAVQQEIFQSADNSAGSNVILCKSRGTAASPTIVNSGDYLGIIRFRGHDGTDYATSAAEIAVQVDGTPGANDMPGRLVFSTCADGASSPTERMRIDSAGNVAIGTTNANHQLVVGQNAWIGTGGGVSTGTGTSRTLTVATNRTVTDVSPSLQLLKGYTSASSTVGGCKIEFASSSHTSPAIGFYTGTSVGNNANVFVEPTWTEQARIDNSGYLRLASGTGGIQFNGDTAAANALDDYEEGTFTPVIEGTTTAGTGTYAAQIGRYTKIGNRVFYNLYIAWTAHTGTGNMLLSGLPFTASAVTNSFSAAVSWEQNLTMTAGNVFRAYVAVNTSTITLRQTPTGGGASAAIPIDTAAELMLSGHYFV